MVNILIVESYFSVGLLYREVLQERGHRVFIALSGKEALLFGLHQDIDIAVVDDSLPDLDAEELLRKLKLLQPHIRSILSISSTFSSPINPDLWGAIFIKSNDFRLLESEVASLCQGSSRTVSPLLKENEEQASAKQIRDEKDYTSFT